MLEHSMRLLELSLDYLEENFDIKPTEVDEVEISLAPLGSYQGCVLFPTRDIETFVAQWGKNPVVYGMNDYSFL